MPDYDKALNEAQYAAVSSADKSVLIIAGAGSGKTRTLVYRLAWLVDHDIPPSAILLLTFTRKAAHEMLERASWLLNGTGLSGILGGTFHSFAYSALKRYPPAWLEGRNFTLMDQADIVQAIKQCRETLKIGKKDIYFPKSQLVASILSKARNKEMPITDILQRDSFHLLPHADALCDIAREYAIYKRQNGLLDYDDLLFELEDLLTESGHAADRLREPFRQILVDEYQDTNLIQARIVRELAGGDNFAQSPAHVMAVGDEAQSIYAFRGANISNILNFPNLFPDTRIIKLEENFRSTQPILDVANNILSHAAESFNKKLFTSQKGNDKVRLITTRNDTCEADEIVRRIEDLLQIYPPHEIAVLFRSGFHSYTLEAALRKAGIPFRKYGGLKFVEASHIKDIISFGRLAVNPCDMPAFSRLASMCRGVGPKTSAKLHKIYLDRDHGAFDKACARFPRLQEDIKIIESLRDKAHEPSIFFERVIDHYRQRMEELYPEDWPARMQGLEEILAITRNYDSLEVFMADTVLETPDEGNDEQVNHITLSTVHSAKGLEWSAVMILDMVEDRFPSRHAQIHPEDFEEERRLFYVACTRAKKQLELYVPNSIYSRAEHGSALVNPSPFILEIPDNLLDRWYEGKHIKPRSILKMESDEKNDIADISPSSNNATPTRDTLNESGPNQVQKNGSSKGYCRHKLFGRGKIIKYLDEDKVQVNFPGFGLKIILAEFLVLEN